MALNHTPRVDGPRMGRERTENGAEGERALERCERRPRGRVCIAASVRGAEREAAHIGAQNTLSCGG